MTLSFLLKRLAQLLPVVLIIIVFNFILMHTAPGDPIYYLIGDAPVSQEFVDNLRANFGLDKPLYQQLYTYLIRVAHADFGLSIVFRASVISVILERLPMTLLLMGTTFIIAFFLGVLLGVLAAQRSGSAFDMGVSILSVVGYAIPIFWLGQMLMLVFSLYLDLFPSQGMISLRDDLSPFESVFSVLHHLILPVCTLAPYFVAQIARLTKANMLEVLRQDYITVARSKGLREEMVIFKHALKNAISPVITIMGLNMRMLITGAVLTETVFGWPGLGRLTYQSIFARDYPVLLGLLAFTGFVVIIANLIVDIIYTYLNPRVRY